MTLFSEYFQDTYATSLLGNMSFVTSEPGLVKSSFSEFTNVVCVLFLLCAHLPHIEFNFSFVKVRCPEFLEIDALSKAIPYARR